jgi:DNA-binding CsgD family transcriptional regulator
MALTMNEVVELTPAEHWAAAWLDAQGDAVVMVDRELRALWSTRAVHEVLFGDSPLALRDGYLIGTNRMRQAQLAGLVEQAAMGPPAAGMFDDEREGRLIVHIRRFDEVATAFGVLIRTDRREIELPDVTAAFGLTAAEQQIVRRLLNGQSATDISDALGIAVLTVRTHIKRAYSKIGVHSKEQLFSRLMGFLG